MNYRRTHTELMRVLFALILTAGVFANEGKEILEAIQEYRKKNNLPPLIPDHRLTSIALKRVEALLGSPNLFNENADIESLAVDNGCQTVSIGENIGRSMYVTNNGMDIFKEWIASPIHRENLMDSTEYTHIGIYRLKTKVDLYVSAVFARFKDTLQQPPNNPQKKEETNLSIKSTRHLAPQDKSRVNASPMDTQMPRRESTPLNDQMPQEKKNQSTNRTPQNNYSNAQYNQTPPLNQQSSPIKESSSAYPMNSFSGPPPGGRSFSGNAPGSNPNIISSSGADSSTFLIALPEHLQRPNSVLKLILVPEITG
ncbi:hypothetical protein NEFER03_2118 [Nematocida sp. LUAm3]|nr:hypothetical protein NEFER03_2118 [Nematocida sp. LUAm3]KAI5175630.1 hypothetical protein NEFER02_1517 [Nematocida sp. LUAm2]KAI5178536.1 hypothetical protein NEFER01_1672 [Nematocida sp. LUAm1]